MLCTNCCDVIHTIHSLKDDVTMFSNFHENGYMYTTFYPEHFIEVIFVNNDDSLTSEISSIFPLYRGINSNHHDAFGNINIDKCDPIKLYLSRNTININYTIKSARIHNKTSLIVLPS
jgi:hypothetical protein